jgi:hypothetical protein
MRNGFCNDASCLHECAQTTCHLTFKRLHSPQKRLGPSASRIASKDRTLLFRVFFSPVFFFFLSSRSLSISPGGDIRFLFCLVLGPVNRRENWKSRERRGENLDNQAFHGLIIKFYLSLMSTMPSLYSQSLPILKTKLVWLSLRQ